MQTSAHVEQTETKEATVKERAIEYYKDNDVAGSLEKLLNVMFLDTPEDINGYMSEYFHKLSKEPILSKVEGIELIDNDGEPSLSLTAHCIINGLEKLMCTYNHPMWPKPKTETSQSNPPSTQEVSQEDIEWVSPLESLPQINDILKGTNVKEQLKINNHINQDQFYPSTQASVTRLAAALLSKVSEVPLFLSISKTFQASTNQAITNQSSTNQASTNQASPNQASTIQASTDQSFHLPLPMSAIIARGNGKLKVRGLYISPSTTTSLNDGISHITNIYKQVGRSLSAKPGLFSLTANGVYSVTSDKIEMVMDLLRDSISTCGLKPKEDVLVFIDVGADSIYNEDKKKYEFVASQWKTGEELITIYSNLMSNYPSLIGFIDPLHPKDAVNWQLLMDKFSENCLIIADKTLPYLPLVKPGSPNEQEAAELNQQSTPLALPHGIVTYSIAQPLSKCFEETSHFKDSCKHVILSTHQCWTTDSLVFDTDLAVALQADLLKISSPVGITSTTVLSRLLEIQDQLKSLNLRPSFSALVSSSKDEC